MSGDIMRLRYVKGAKELIASKPELIIDNINNDFIDLDKLFSNDLPIHIEIGMGKGKFVYTMALLNPNINYIGIERFDSVIVRALEKVIEEPLSNLMLLRTDASDLREIFSSKSIDRVYLNFSDPWPKDRHAKRRLTHKNFLNIYKDLLKEDSEVHFKTDNKELFDFSVEELTNYPMDLTYIELDLHNSDFEGNIMTEFEEKFSKLGNKIYKLTAKF
jgi:tRNA (guanine-N7-)-methyltransferase